MPATQATTLAQRREMMRLVEEGHTYAAVAEHVGVSFWTARKWIRLAVCWREKFLMTLRAMRA